MIRRHPLVAYFALTFGFTWGLMIPAVPFLQGVYEGDIPILPAAAFMVGAYGPTFAAIFVTALVGGKAGVKGLLSRFKVWRVGVRWYALLVLTPLSLTALALLLNVLAGGEPPTGTDFGRWYMFLPALLVGLPFGPMAEEAGWRGFAQPRLQALHGPVAASLILGLAWGLWHLPAFFVPVVALPGGETGDPGLIAWYVLATVSVTVFYTWVYNNTKGSLVVDVLFHAAWNTMPAFLISMVYPGLRSGGLILQISHLNVVLLCAVAVILVVATRGRLSYDAPARPAAAQKPGASEPSDAERGAA